MFDKIRMRRTQPEPTVEQTKPFRPGWLAQQQRGALRALVLALAASLGLNGFQVYKREQIAAAPPEVFAALLDSDFTSRSTSAGENPVTKIGHFVARSWGRTGPHSVGDATWRRGSPVASLTELGEGKPSPGENRKKQSV